MKRRNEILVGGLLLVSLAIGILGTIWLVRGGFRSGYPLYSVFRWGTNLKVGQAVRLAGVQVGYVEDVQLRDDGTLVLNMAIEEGRKIPRNARAIVQAVGIFGDAEVALLGQPDTRFYASGDTVPAGAAALAAVVRTLLSVESMDAESTALSVRRTVPCVAESWRDCSAAMVASCATSALVRAIVCRMSARPPLSTSCACSCFDRFTAIVATLSPLAVSSGMPGAAAPAGTVSPAA